MLDVLEARELAPQKAGLDERERKSYERADTTVGSLRHRRLTSKLIYIGGEVRPLITRRHSLWDAAYVEIHFEPTPAESEWARVFELADALAECIHPDRGAAGITFDRRNDLRRAPANRDERR